MGPTVDEVAMGQGFLRILQFCHVSITPPMLHIQFHVALTRRTNARRLWTFGIREHCGEKYSLFLGDSSPLCSRCTSKEQRFTSQNTTSIMDIHFI